MNFQSKLRSLRKAAGLTQAELAEHLNVSRQAISRWESGIATPERDNIIALSQFFAISTDDLLLHPSTEPAKPNLHKTKKPAKFSTKKLIILLLVLSSTIILAIMTHTIGTVSFIIFDLVVIYAIYRLITAWHQNKKAQK